MKRLKGFWYREFARPDRESVPTFYRTKKELIDDFTSMHGHACDDPLKRGVIARAELILHPPASFTPTQELRDYYERFQGKPALLVMDNPSSIERQLKRASERQRAILKRFAKAKL